MPTMLLLHSNDSVPQSDQVALKYGNLTSLPRDAFIYMIFVFDIQKEREKKKRIRFITVDWVPFQVNVVSCEREESLKKKASYTWNL